MSAGVLVGSVITLFGAIAGGALVAQGVHPDLGVNELQTWIVYVLCFGAGVLMLMAFSRLASTPLLMQLPGALAILLGLIAGGAALAKALGLLPPGDSTSLWALLILSTPPGVLLLTGASALRNPSLEPK
ncbi:MAG TPA: hypothetical protein VGN52_22930 [Burkholderiales bacterium]